MDRLLALWRNERTIFENIADWHVEPERQPMLDEFPLGVHPLLRGELMKRGIDCLYTHQVQTWEAVQARQNVVLVTGTASGKTLGYNLPVLDRAIRDADATALYVFPTKALTADQKQNLDGLTRDLHNGQPGLSIPAAVYDGDTPASQRSSIRQQARILLTNPDMLHIGILPHHTLWAAFLRNLRTVVIDEIHIYRGVFGSHVANVIRRLKRVASFYGSHPTFILTSATIANPRQLAEGLTGEEVRLIDEDGSPRGEKHFILYNPPLIKPELGLRRSASQESVRLAGDLLTYGVQTILFGKARRTVELVLKALQTQESSFSSQMRGYRSGYLPTERREIETSLRRGQTRVVVATNALELGVDIGGMGAVVLVGYPGTIAALRQQAGRAGRRVDTSLAVLVASSAPVDQFLMKHPEFLFGRSPERAFINPDHLVILLEHLRCAAFELPFKVGEGFDNTPLEIVQAMLDVLVESGDLHLSGGRYYWMQDQYPANRISLRSASEGTVLLQAASDYKLETIGEVDEASAVWMVHPGAVYLHEGQTYCVDELDLDRKTARLQRLDVDYFTETRKQVTIEKISVLRQSHVKGGEIYYGEILVTSQVVGFRKIKWLTHENLGEESLDMPASLLRTTAYWLTIAPETVDALRDQGLWSNDINQYGKNWLKQRNLARQRDAFTCQVCGAPEKEQAHPVHHKIPFRQFQSYEQANQLDNLITLCSSCHQKAELAVKMRSGLAGLGYVLHNLSPLFLMCDSGDIEVNVDANSKLGEGLPTVILYELIPAGIGLCDFLYQIHDQVIQQAFDLVQNCGCSEGCPGCVGPAGEGGTGGKAETLALLNALK